VRPTASTVCSLTGLPAWGAFSDWAVHVGQTVLIVSFFGRGDWNAGPGHWEFAGIQLARFGIVGKVED
jgi:hypothetical protein